MVWRPKSASPLWRPPGPESKGCWFSTAMLGLHGLQGSQTLFNDVHFPYFTTLSLHRWYLSSGDDSHCFSAYLSILNIPMKVKLTGLQSGLGSIKRTSFPLLGAVKFFEYTPKIHFSTDCDFVGVPYFRSGFKGQLFYLTSDVVLRFLLS